MSFILGEEVCGWVGGRGRRWCGRDSSIVRVYTLEEDEGAEEANSVVVLYNGLEGGMGGFALPPHEVTISLSAPRLLALALEGKSRRTRERWRHGGDFAAAMHEILPFPHHHFHSTTHTAVWPSGTSHAHVVSQRDILICRRYLILLSRQGKVVGPRATQQ